MSSITYRITVPKIWTISLILLNVLLQSALSTILVKHPTKSSPSRIKVVMTREIELFASILQPKP
jgi:hypothetical protein